jgi:hypothetical protein
MMTLRPYQSDQISREMDAFDSLPLPIRNAVADSSIKWNAGDLRILLRKKSVEQVLKMILDVPAPNG